MKLITVDFETYWDANHSLSKMSPIAYVMDSKTQLISMGIKMGDGETQVVFGEHKIREVIDSIDWSNAYVIGHNMSGFDSMILAWRLGVKPKLWGCTLAMARPIHAKTIGNSLEKLVQHYGVGVKDKTALVNTKGKRLEDFTADEIEAMAKYNAADVDQCYQLFTKLRPFYTAKELWLIDATIRMLVEPKFVIDYKLLESALAEERENKRKAIMAVADHLQRMGLATDEMALCTTEEELEEAVRKALASANKFAALLESLSVEVPMKPSPTNPDRVVPALAKTDEEFQKLKEHVNPVVAAAVRARLAVRSTILETRIEAFMEVSRATGGKLPVPLHYCGADTTGRWSGWAYNCFLGDTEVLTEQGWVRFDAWKGEPIAQWWPDGSITMEYNPGVLVKPYAGPVVDIESRCVSSTMTPDHRLVSCPPTKSGIKEHTAGWVAEHSGLDNIPAAGVWVGVSDSVMTPELVRLAVAFSADGCVVGNTIQVGLRRERKITRMRELLEAAGVPYRIREYPPQEGHKGAHNTVFFVIKNPPVGKGFGPWILRLSREALDALVSELVHWDGQPHHKSGRLCFWTTQRSDAEWVQTALALSGVVSTIREYPPRNPAHKPKLLVYARKEPYTSIDTARDVTVREYEGLVYCASVESSYILIRRNSKISVVGQCQNLPRITPDKPKPSDALRKSMRAPEGYKVVVADQSGIELRVNHFLWKVPSSMALYKKDRKADLYKAFAAARYGISPEEVTKEQRQLAKLCLAEGTLVLTKRGEIPIEQVTASDKVWDGVEWVSTLGAIYRGEKEVIEYDGLIATPDHEVWTDCGRKVPLWYAAAQSLRLARTGAGGVPLGFSGASNDRDLQNQGKQVCEGTVCDVWNNKINLLLQPKSREDSWVSVVQSEMRSTKMAFAATRSSQTEMYKPEGQGVRQIRRSGDSVQVQERSGSSRVGNGEFGSAQGQGVGQDRQQRPLRAGESTMGYTQAECGESEAVAIEAVPLVSGATSRDTLRGHHTSQIAIEGANVRADNREVEPPVRQTKRRVWDLLNCGPRNRFTANGRLVSNCQLGLGFGCGWKKFKLIAKTMGGLDLSDAEAEAVTTDWRNNYPEIVRGWRVCHEALQWIHDGVERPIDPWGLCWTSKYGIRLPSGRFIRYPGLHLEKTSDGNYEWWYGHGRHRTRIYAGKVTENLIQSLARDIIADNMFSFYKETGLYPALMVHDELVYVAPENQAEKLLDKLQQIMRTPPQWWPDIILESEGDIADTYGDAK